MNGAGAMRSVPDDFLPRGGADGLSRRVVVAGHGRREVIERLLRAGVSPKQVVSYSTWMWPIVWLRLIWFLGWSRAVRVTCLATRDSAALKLLAFALRGEVEFRLPGKQSVSLRVDRFLWLAFKTWGRRPGDICLVGTADPERLERILADLRQRYPGASVHALLPASAPRLAVDTRGPLSAAGFLAAARRRPRFSTLALPCTGEGVLWPKLLVWCLPLGSREIYNDNCDFYSPREVHLLLRHAWNSVPNRVCVLGTTTPARLAEIVGDLKQRHPGASLHGFLPRYGAEQASLFHSAVVLSATSARTYRSILSFMIGRGRSGHMVFPFTGEGNALLKAVFWLLPLGRREFHNEHGDFCRGRDFGALYAHLGRRLANRMTRRPPRVTVLGSASGLYLKTIVADLRRRYPRAPIHGLLPGRLAVPVAHLFDSYTVIQPSSSAFWRGLWELSTGRRRSGHFVIPCTNEGYASLKASGVFLPLGLREVYNENGDAYFPRHLSMLWRHTFWRLRHRIFYQALTERNGRFWMRHMAHLLLYPARLVAGALVLAGVRLRTRFGVHFRSRPHLAQDHDAVRDLPAAGSRLQSRTPVASGDP